MKKFLLLLVAVMASVTAWAGASDYYFVGKPTSWVEPSEKNSDFYEQYRLEKSGVVAGQAVYRLALDVAAGDAMFRFYKGLGGWDDGSIGVQENDVPTEFYWSEDMDDIDLMPGKGAISLPDWPGGRMYITLWNNIISVSAEDFRDISMSRYYEANCLPVWTSGEVSYLKPLRGHDGVYTGILRTSTFFYVCDKSVYATGLELGDKWIVGEDWNKISEHCLYYNGSEHFVVPFLQPDWAGVTTTDYQKGSGNCDTPDIAAPNSYRYFTLIVDTNKNKLYTDDGSTYFAVGKLTDNKYPTYENYEEFRPYATWRYSSNTIEVPAGKMDFFFTTLKNFGDIEQPEHSCDLRANETENPLNYFRSLDDVRGRLYADNWNGGYIKLCYQGYKLYEDCSLRLEAITSDGVKEFERQPGTNIYKATVSERLNKTLSVSVQQVAYDGNNNRQVVGSFHNNGNNDLIIYEGTEPEKVSVDPYGGTSFDYPQAETGTEVTLTLDLDDMTLTSEIEAGKAAPVVYVYNGAEYGSFVMADCGDGLYTYNDFVPIEWLHPVLVKNNKRYNLWYGQNMTYLERGSGDANGVFSYKFDLENHATSGGFAGFNGCSYMRNVSVAVDIKAETVTIQSPFLMEGSENVYGFAPRMYVGILNNDCEWTIAPNMRNISKLPFLKGSIYDNGNIIGYRGSIPVGKVKDCTVYFGTTVGHSFITESVGLNPDVNDILKNGFYFDAETSADVIDFENLEEMRIIKVAGFESGGLSSIQAVNLPEGYLDIEVFLNTDYTYYMYLMPRYAGVENVTDDALAGAVIAGGDGCIVVDSPAGMTVAVYDLSGRLVREERVDAGRTVLDGIARGLYVANGTKVVVR